MFRWSSLVFTGADQPCIKKGPKVRQIDSDPYLDASRSGTAQRSDPVKTLRFAATDCRHSLEARILFDPRQGHASS